jgi:hypothetical protein
MTAFGILIETRLRELPPGTFVHAFAYIHCVEHSRITDSVFVGYFNSLFQSWSVSFGSLVALLCPNETAATVISYK